MWVPVRSWRRQRLRFSRLRNVEVLEDGQRMEEDEVSVIARQVLLDGRKIENSDWPDRRFFFAIFAHLFPDCAPRFQIVKFRLDILDFAVTQSR